MNDFDPGVSSAVAALIRDVPDFPKPGIVFKDLTPVLADGPTWKRLIDAFVDRYRTRDVSAVVAIEARGFLLGAPLAAQLGLGLILLRKPGKLPWRRVGQSYALEYGTDTLEMHEDAIRPGQRVVVVDDLLATGGTMRAAVDLVRSRGAEVVEAGFIVELAFLDGRSRLNGVPVGAVVRY